LAIVRPLGIVEIGKSTWQDYLIKSYDFLEIINSNYKIIRRRVGKTPQQLELGNYPPPESKLGEIIVNE